MKRIKINKDLCDSCLNCTLACMSSHNPDSKSIYDLDLQDNRNEARNHIALGRNKKAIPVFCRHCNEPECVNTCMSSALTKNRETGFVEYNPEKCASCYMCVISCEYGVLKPSDRNKCNILKCDMCKDKDTPQCVANCPTGALTYEEVD